MFAWPLEPVLFQTFVPQGKAGFVPVKGFQFVTLPVAKDKQGTGTRRQVLFTALSSNKAVFFSQIIFVFQGHVITLIRQT